MRQPEGGGGGGEGRTGGQEDDRNESFCQSAGNDEPTTVQSNPNIRRYKSLIVTRGMPAVRTRFVIRRPR